MRKTILTLIVSFFLGVTFIYIDCVINGKSALRNEFASTVRLVFNTENTDRPLCTGVILNEILILTAGHCLREVQNLSNIEVIAGDYHRITLENTEQRRQVVDNYSHPQMDYELAMVYDLTILRLDVPLTFDDSVLPTTLPENNLEIKDGEMTFAGWGVSTEPTPEELKYPNFLQKVILQVLDTKICGQEYDDIVGFSGALLGFNVHENATTSYADSGGGAFRISGSENVLAGILSYVADCHRPASAAVFTRIDEAILVWIRETVNDTQHYLNDLLIKTNLKNKEHYRRNNLFIAVKIIAPIIIIAIIIYIIIHFLIKYRERNINRYNNANINQDSVEEGELYKSDTHLLSDNQFTK